MSYADRVRAGVALLDEENPGWHQQIKLEELQLNSCYWCVLGQLFGEFHVGLSRLVGPYDQDDEVDRAGSFGFDMTADDYFGEDDMQARAYTTLTRLWTYVIRSRQVSS